MGIVVSLAKFSLRVVYFFIKIFPTRNKVVFLSRQSDKPSIDFNLLSKELKKQNKNVKIVMLTKRIGKGICGKLEYAFHMWIQMYHVATSKVAIIDGYQIVISVLKHKKKLKVIQIWHALGSLKKFGYSIADKEEGSKKEIIKRNLLAGIFRGVGIGIGVTLITAIIIAFLQRIIKLNIPVISEYIVDIVEIVENNKRY